MTQLSLKLVALLSMLMDHLAKVLLSTGIFSDALGVSMDLYLRTMMIAVGRLAFPIFAWFTAEGCKKTKDPKKYLLRMLIFAILSEIPFRLCFYGRVASFTTSNVLFTFLFAACAIFAAQWLQTKRIPYPFAVMVPSVAAMVICWVQYTDYNAWGCALVLLLYYMPNEKGRLLALGSWITLFQLIWKGSNGGTLTWISGNDYNLLLQWVVEMLAVLFLAAYNGEKGSDKPWAKWLFYVFYPVHLLLLYLIRMAL